MHFEIYAIVVDILVAFLSLALLEFGYFPGRLTSFWKRLIINSPVIDDNDNTNDNEEARNARLHATPQDTRKKQVRFREEDTNYQTSKEGQIRNRITKSSLSQHPVLTQATAKPKAPSNQDRIEFRPPSKRSLAKAKPLMFLKRWRPKPPSTQSLATAEPTPPSKQLLTTAVTQAMEFHLLKLWYTACEIRKHILLIPKSTKSFWKQSLSALAMAVANMIEAPERSKYSVREIDSEEDADDEREIETILMSAPTAKAESLGVQLPTEGSRPQTQRHSKTKHSTPILQQMAAMETLKASIRGRVLRGKFYPEGVFEPERPTLSPQIPFAPPFWADPRPCLFSSTVDSLFPSRDTKPTSPSLASEPVPPQPSVDYDPKSQSDFFEAMRNPGFQFPAAESRGAEGTIYPDVTYTAEEREERIHEIKIRATLSSGSSTYQGPPPAYVKVSEKDLINELNFFKHFFKTSSQTRAEATAREEAAAAAAKAAAKTAAKRRKQEEAVAKAQAKKKEEEQAAAVQAKAKKRRQKRARANYPPPNQVQTSPHLLDDDTDDLVDLSLLRTSFPCLSPTPLFLPVSSPESPPVEPPHWCTKIPGAKNVRIVECKPLREKIQSEESEESPLSIGYLPCRSDLVLAKYKEVPITFWSLPRS